MGKRARTWRKAIVVSLAGVLLLLALLEGTLRMAGIGYPPFFQFDPDVGLRRLSPGVEGWYANGEGKAYVRINSDGLRDQEHALAKPPGTLRIAVLGNSFAEAFLVPPEKSFWAVMERSLTQCKALQGTRVEAINFGVSWYGTADEWVALQTGVWKYDPDIVVLTILTSYDVTANSYALSGGDPSRPYYRLRDGRLDLEAPATGKGHGRLYRAVRDWLLPHSRLVQLLYHLRGTYASEPWGMGAQEKAVAPGMDPLEEKVYRAPQDASWRQAWDVTEALIREMNKNVVAHGKKFFVATLSNGIQVDPDRAKREAFAKRYGISDFFYPDHRIMHLSRQEGIPAAMLAPVLLEWSEKHRTCVHGFGGAVPCGGHWNEDGNRVAGELLARDICSGILSKGQPR